MCVKFQEYLDKWVKVSLGGGGELVLCWMMKGKLAIDSMEFHKWWTEASEGRLIGEKSAEASEISEKRHRGARCFNGACF